LHVLEVLKNFLAEFLHSFLPVTVIIDRYFVFSFF